MLLLEREKDHENGGESGKHTLLALSIEEELHRLESSAAGHGFMAELALVLIAVEVAVAVLGLICRMLARVLARCRLHGMESVCPTESEHVDG